MGLPPTCKGGGLGAKFGLPWFTTPIELLLILGVLLPLPLNRFDLLTNGFAFTLFELLLKVKLKKSRKKKAKNKENQN